MRYVHGLALVSLLLAGACKHSEPRGSSLRTADQGAASAAFVHSLADVNDYYAYAGRAGSATALKFTIDIKADGAPLYLQNTTRYPFHAQFLTENLPKFKTMSFQEYTSYIFGGPGGDGKELSAGVLLYAPTYQLSPDQPNGTMAVEYYMGTEGAALTEADLLSALPFIEQTFTKLAAALPFVKGRLAILIPSGLRFRARSAVQRLKDAGIPVLWDSDRVRQDLFATGDVEVYHAATSYGYLRPITAADLAAGSYSSKDILLMTEIPLDIGPVAGMITTIPQTPLAHIMLRALNQNIPDLFILGALDKDDIKRHVGKLVQLTAKADKTYTIKGAGEVAGDIQALADEYFRTRIPALPPLTADLSEQRLLPWPKSPVVPDQVQSYGAKGINFALLDAALRRSGVDRSSYDGGFLIPFAFYQRHMQGKIKADACTKAQKKCAEETGAACADPRTACEAVVAAGKPLSAFVTTMLDSSATPRLNDPVGRREYLAFLRELIEKVKINESDLAAVNALLTSGFTKSTRIRFRSSTNAEDLPGLNGAGLYESKSGCLQDDIDDAVGAAVANKPSGCRTTTELRRINERLPKLDAVKDAATIADLTKDITQKYPVAKALRQVWASLWTDRAFVTREYYNLRHDQVYMGILVAPSFVDESANGVIIAADGAAGATDITISAQTEDHSITNPILRGASPEYLTVTRAADGTLGTPTYLRRSSLVAGTGKVLDDATLASLAAQVAVVHNDQKSHLGSRFTGKTDLEFIVNAGGVVLIKQARPLPKTPDGTFGRE